MLPQIVWKPSPNFTKGRLGYEPIIVVIHRMEGTLVGTDAWFGNPVSKVSSHYGIGKSGAIHQYVKEENAAWHAGISKVVNKSTGDWVKAHGLIDSTGRLVNPNFYSIGIEHEGFIKNSWSDAMVDSSAQLIADICYRHKIPFDAEHIVGHHRIYFGHQCPGNNAPILTLIDKAIKYASQLGMWEI